MFGDGGDEHFAIPARRRGIGRIHELLTVRSEDRDDLLEVSRFGGINERAHGVLRAGELALLSGGGGRACRERTQHGAHARHGRHHASDTALDLVW